MKRNYVTIITDKKGIEPQIISPGVRQGAKYRVIEEGADCVRIRLNGKPVWVDNFLTTAYYR